MYPPFHTSGDPVGDFYALAFCEGTYVSPSGSTREDGFLVLYFSPTPEFTRLSYQTCTVDGRPLSYARGNDEHDTVEFALLRAWYEYRLPPHGWKLYPAAHAARELRAAVQDHMEGYARMRRALAGVLYPLRLAEWLRQSGNVQPLFYPRAVQLTNPLDPTPENEEFFDDAPGETGEHAL